MSQPVIEPVNFGAPERGLFGIFHAPAQVCSRPGVLLCQAFGQEAVRAHRMMRVTAERLARQGHPVLRFDYHGTGDALGDDRDGDLAGWAQDVLIADAELRRRGAVSETIWLGMRLGALVALRAARQAPGGLRKLVLWDPLLDGRRYLDYLRERHIVAIEKAFAVKASRSPRVVAKNPCTFRDEAIGYALSPELRDQLQASAAGPELWPASHVAVVVVSDQQRPEAADLNQALTGAAGQRVRVLTVNHGTDWTSDTADNSALVPTQALMALVQQVGEGA
ncbi:serine aminopeptidase domain-containing protein [Aquabacterium sp.]|uniref:serine aminopeptidase domain-containing protein n=1 Tax=Aquabacterium sp. TaxID=1872578 RepID=UPI0035B0DA77